MALITNDFFYDLLLKSYQVEMDRKEKDDLTMFQFLDNCQLLLHERFELNNAEFYFLVLRSLNTQLVKWYKDNKESPREALGYLETIRSLIYQRANPVAS